ncbi:MAG: cell division protein ZapA [Candidatus Babeliaceae bacterium]|nr:cell division protein ZapA [Candidatus Babeliaceae bacterium]
MIRSTEQVTYSIFGQSYTLATDEDRGEVDKAVAEVDNLMTQIARSMPGVDPFRIATLAAIRLAHERDNLRREVEEGEVLSELIAESIDRECTQLS